jgi:hypothetical protein
VSALALAAADTPFAPGVCTFDSRINNQTPSQSVAVSRSDFVEGLVKVSRPITEKVKVIHGERTVRTVKSVLAHFPIATYCRPICSDRKCRRASYGLYVIFYGWVYGGRGGRSKNFDFH